MPKPNYTTKFFKKNSLRLKIKNSNTQEQSFIFGAVYARIDWNINIRVFIWLGEIELWRKSKTVFHGYRKFHCVHNIDDIYKEIAKDVKQELTLQIMSLKDHYQKERTRKLFD